MREVLAKVIKVALASALVFMVAAPLIVGVYDAVNSGRNPETGAAGNILYEFGGSSSVGIEATGYGLSQNVSGGNVEGQAVDGSAEGTSDGVHSAISNRESSEVSGDSARSVQGDNSEGNIPVEQSSDSDILHAWYSGDSSTSNLFAGDGAHLVYTFSDGSTVDFGNPYFLGWSDVLQPDDFDKVISGDDGTSSAFSPEKAYAGPVSFIWSKGKYLMQKAGIWETLNRGLISLFITGASAIGMQAPAISEMMAKFQAEMPAVMELASKEGIVVSEEDAALLVSDAIMTASQRGYAASEIASKMPELINEEAASINTTGQLLGGSSSNFMNTLYQLLAEGQVSASFINSNPDFWTTLFSWLGADLTNFSDLPSGVGGNATVTLGAVEIPIHFAEYPLEVEANAKYNSTNWLTYRVNADGSYTFVYPKTSDSQLSIFMQDNGNYNIRTNLAGGNSYDLEVYYPNEDRWAAGSGSYSVSYSPSYMDQFFVNSNYPIYFFDSKSAYDSGVDSAMSRYSPETGWSGTGVVADAQFQPFNGDIVGKDAAYDSAGNITDYGNVSVPDVTNPAYVQPNTYADALAAMNAAAAQNAATAESPAWGQTDTSIGDWINNNQTPAPEPGSEEGSQDDFKIEDLEKVFPFCIPWDIYYLLSVLNADPTAPSFTWHFDFAIAGSYDYTVDLSPYESVAAVVRVCEALAFCVGLALITRDLIRG